jgi:hypothetical protein
MTRRALFTAITGEYETLNELQGPARGSLDALCFTDNPNLSSDTWKIVYIEPAFPLDPIRSQRSVKVVRHAELLNYDQTLYIDNSVRLKVDPSTILDAWLASAELAMPEHRFRESVDAEFDADIEHRLDSRDRVLEQHHHYSEAYPQCLAEKPLWGALIARKNTESVALFERIWLDHVLRYSRRDQLSAVVAAEISGVSLNRVQLDNYDSTVHFWPIASARSKELRHGFWPDVSELENRIADSEREIASLKSELFAVWGSPSWKLTRPLRGVANHLGRPPKSD